MSKKYPQWGGSQSGPTQSGPQQGGQWSSYGGWNAGPQSGFGPQSGPGTQSGYGAQGGYGSQAGYGSQSGYGPQTGYGPQGGAGPQPGYGPQQSGPQGPGAQPRIDALDLLEGMLKDGFSLSSLTRIARASGSNFWIGTAIGAGVVVLLNRPDVRAAFSSVFSKAAAPEPEGSSEVPPKV